MNRGEFLEAGLVAAVGLTPLAKVVGASICKRRKRPNILFVFTDQQTLNAMSCRGNPWLKTPAMDSLAASGVLFERSYCTAPVCTPSRSSLITGLMPRETGADYNATGIKAGILNMGHIFREAGYETAWAGKWHLPTSYPRKGKPVEGNKEKFEDGTLPGFEHLVFDIENEEAAENYGSKKWFAWAMGYLTDPPTADAAIRFLRRKHDKPFLLAVSFHNPHDICLWIRHEWKSSPNIAAYPPLPANFEPSPDEPEFVRLCRQRGHYGEELRWTEKWDQTRWRAYLYDYYRMTEAVDAQIGRVLAALREQGLEDDTLIVFTSDHGEGLAAHRWVVKLSFYENCVAVPLILSWKGATPAGVVDSTHLASGADILPTMCDYAGIPHPRMTGASLKPVIQNPRKPGSEFVVAELAPDPKRPDMKGRMVRTRRYKYIAFSLGKNPEMLFDADADPGETRNLAGHPAMKATLAEHRSLLAKWCAQTADSFQLPSHD